jgi:hypothetical protein
MAYTSFAEDKPVINENGDVVINYTRTNLMALRDAIVMGALKSWNLSVSGGTVSEPAIIYWTRSTEKIRATITWGTSGGSDGQPSVVVYAYSSNSGSSWDTIGTLTFSYESGGSMTSSVWS